MMKSLVTGMAVCAALAVFVGNADARSHRHSHRGNEVAHKEPVEKGSYHNDCGTNIYEQCSYYRRSKPRQ
jgi:hypothetical protein